MYKIIGADRREYGPVPAEQVRKWIADGRADAQTKAWSEGGSEWKALSDFPEFAEALAAKAPAGQPSPPKIGAVDAEKLATEIVARDYRVDIGDCFSRSWNLVKDNFWPLAGATALISLIWLGMQFIPMLGHAAAVLFGFLLWGGSCLLFLKRLRGKPADISDVFTGFSLAFVPLMLASIVAHVLTGIGLMLCVAPGIYLLVAWWMFVPLLIIDKGLEFWPAMELSRKVVTKHWWPCFGLFLLSCLVALIGSLACGVGIFFTLPIAIGATVCAYEDIFGMRPATNELLAPAALSGPGSIAGPASQTAPAQVSTLDTGSTPSTLAPDIGSTPATPPEADSSPGTPPPTTPA